MVFAGQHQFHPDEDASVAMRNTAPGTPEAIVRILFHTYADCPGADSDETTSRRKMATIRHVGNRREASR